MVKMKKTDKKEKRQTKRKEVIQKRRQTERSTKKKTADKKGRQTHKKKKNRQTFERDHRGIIFASLYTTIKKTKWVISFYWGIINAMSLE